MPAALARDTGFDGEMSVTELHAEWMQRVAAHKDRDAFRALFDYYGPRINAVMLKSGASRETAEDLAQDAMMTVWRKAELYKPEAGSVSAWVFTIARNTRIDKLRRGSSRPHQDVDDLELEDEAPDGEANAIASQRADLVSAALDVLSAEQRQIIEMAYIEDMAQSEISQKLDLPLGTVKSRMRLAYGKLKQQLEILK